MIRRQAGDLIAVVAIASVAAVLAILVDSGPVAVAALLPLVLFLPGYALSALFFPPGGIGRDFRLVLAVALSISATALSGVVLQVFITLGRGAFVAALAAITIGAAALAVGRRAERDGGARATDLALPDWALPSAVAIAIAITTSGVALAVATDGVERHFDDVGFTSLWLVPQQVPGTPPNSPPVVVGVANHTQRNLRYRLQVTQDGSAIQTWKPRIDAGGQWSATLPADAVSGVGPLVAHLSGGGDERRVALVLGPAERS